jgi:hypothetical protein
LYRFKPSNQVRTERSRPVKAHAHTYISSLNPDDETVDFNGPTVNNKTDGVASINNTIPLCLCDKVLSHGSCIGRPDQLLPMHISEGDQILVTMTEGENGNPLLQQATIQLTTGSAYPLPSGNQQKKWLLQDNGFHVPDFSEKSSSPFVSSMTYISSDKPEPRVSQTWSVIATVIKRQEQLNESHYITTVDSQVAMDNNLDTISAITSSDDTALSLLDKAEQDNEYSDTLDTEHDVFADSISKGDDRDIDIFDSINIEGSPALRVKI